MTTLWPFSAHGSLPPALSPVLAYFGELECYQTLMKDLPCIKEKIEIKYRKTQEENLKLVGMLCATNKFIGKLSVLHKKFKSDITLKINLLWIGFQIKTLDWSQSRNVIIKNKIAQ
ncbi:hypothetical protein [Zobellella endophytica]|uniref:hypothetical protein n=1 Tax=Zobellella endophytica TaxID=2116700 RepID=UPI00144482A0|nr:hypothetical protein [Zobellella endophytica]